MSTFRDVSALCDEYTLALEDVLELIAEKYAEQSIETSTGRILLDESVAEALVAELTEEMIATEALERGTVARPYSSDEMGELFGMPKNALLKILRDARSTGVTFPGVITVRTSDGPGRPAYAFLEEFIASFTAWRESETFTSPASNVTVGDEPAPDLRAAQFLLQDADPLAMTVYELVLKARGKRLSLDTVADVCNVSPRKVRESVERLRYIGHDLQVSDALVMLNSHPVAEVCPQQPTWGGDRIRIGVVSDLHLGAQQTKLASLQHAYQEFERVGCAFAVNCGDTFHGPSSMHRGFEYELKLHSLEHQLEFCTAQYPRNLPTYMIDGNHDMAWHKVAGVYPSKFLCREYDGWHWAGSQLAALMGPQGQENFFEISHPSDAGSANPTMTSARITQWNTSAPDATVPLITACGHYHKFNVYDGPMGSVMVQCPASCDMTGWQRNKHLINQMGALILEFVLEGPMTMADFSVRRLLYRPGCEVNYETFVSTTPTVSLGPTWRGGQDG